MGASFDHFHPSAASEDGTVNSGAAMVGGHFGLPPGGGGGLSATFPNVELLIARRNEYIGRVRQAANEYDACGWKLCAIEKGSKGPKVKGWQHQPLDIGAIGHHGLGLIHALSGTCAVDVDDMQQADGWFAAHGVELRDLLAADDAVQISSGRAHRAKLLYRLPPGVEPLITKQIKIDGAMILEFRCAATGGSGCQDVLPPTIHPNTNAEYQWSGAGDFNNLPFLPEQLLKIWRDERGPDVSRLHEVKRESDAIVEGSRNTTLFQLAGDLFGLGLHYESVLDVVMKENAIKCAPSLPPHEVEALVRSAQSNSRGSKQMADQQALNAAVEAAADAAAKEAAEQVAPDDFVAQLPTVLQDIAVWYEKRAVMPQPAFKVAIALAAAGAVLARDFTGAGGAFTHLYCVLIGPPGSGKEAALRSVKDIVTVYDASRLPGNPASDAGVLAALMRDPACCFVMDELGEVLKGIFDSKAAGYKAAIGTTFLELYSKGGTRYFGREYAKQTGLDGRARVDIYSPCPSIFGTTTPSTFYAALSSDAVSSGFVPRLLTFRAPDKIPYMKEPEDVPLPTSVCNWLDAIKARVQAAQKGAQAGG